MRFREAQPRQRCRSPGAAVWAGKLPWCMAGWGSSGARSSAAARSWPEPINHAFRAASQAPVRLHECLEALQHLAA